MRKLSILHFIMTAKLTQDTESMSCMEPSHYIRHVRSVPKLFLDLKRLVKSDELIWYIFIKDNTYTQKKQMKVFIL